MVQGKNRKLRIRGLFMFYSFTLDLIWYKNFLVLFPLSDSHFFIFPCSAISGPILPLCSALCCWLSSSSCSCWVPRYAPADSRPLCRSRRSRLRRRSPCAAPSRGGGNSAGCTWPWRSWYLIVQQRVWSAASQCRPFKWAEFGPASAKKYLKTDHAVAAHSAALGGGALGREGGVLVVVLAGGHGSIWVISDI